MMQPETSAVVLELMDRSGLEVAGVLLVGGEQMYILNAASLFLLLARVKERLEQEGLGDVPLVLLKGPN